MEMLVDVASQGEATGYEVPCLIVAAAKDSLDPHLSVIQDSTRVLILECVHFEYFWSPPVLLPVWVSTRVVQMNQDLCLLKTLQA